MSTFFAVCMSAILPYTLTLGDATEHGTIVYRTPPHCSAGVLPEVQGPPAPPRYDYAPKQTAEAAPAAKSKVAATPAKAKKRAQRPCKKGRTRNSRGVCGRW
jgi:hypothetical protein